MKLSLIKILYYQKFLGIFLIVIGIPLLFVPQANSEVPLMFGFFTLFTSLEKVNDERSVSLKSSSLLIAFICSYTFKLVTSTLHQHGFIDWELIAINYFVILVLALGTLIFSIRMRLS